MTTVQALLERKHRTRPTLTIDATSTVLAATQLMNAHSVGCLIVTAAGGMVGIFTERDVLRRIVAEERPAAATLVEDVMTTEVACCSPETTIEEARGVMMNRRIRHLPIVSADGQLAGLVSIGDLNAVAATSQETTIHFLNEYLHGRV